MNSFVLFCFVFCLNFNLIMDQLVYVASSRHPSSRNGDCVPIVVKMLEQPRANHGHDSIIYKHTVIMGKFMISKLLHFAIPLCGSAHFFLGGRLTCSYTLPVLAASLTQPVRPSNVRFSYPQQSWVQSMYSARLTPSKIEVSQSEKFCDQRNHILALCRKQKSF